MDLILPTKASFTNSVVQHAWDSSSLSTYLRCPRRYFYTYICNYRPLNESYDLVFGTLFHRAMEEYHLEKLSRGHAEAQILGLQALLRAAWNEQTLSYWKSESSNKNLWNCLRAFIWHTEHFAFEPDFQTTLLGKKLYAVELPFTFDLNLKVNGISASYCGHLDRVVDTASGRWVVDYKTTTKTLTGSYFDTYNPSTQLPGYAVAASIVFHEPVQGVIIDAMQVGVDFTRCGRSHLRLGTERAEEWMHNAHGWVEDAMLVASSATLSPDAEDLKSFAVLNAKHWRMNTESCFICPFKEVCRTTPSLRGDLLDLEFTTSVWDPINRQRENVDASGKSNQNQQIPPGESSPRQPQDRDELPAPGLEGEDPPSSPRPPGEG
jgi:hypothetical protein